MKSNYHIPKVAIVHEWFVNYAGSERVVEQMLKVYPDADLFSLVDFLGPGERKFINHKETKTSFIQKLPLAKKFFRVYLPLMPIAIEQFDLSKYDIIISSSHAFSKGVLLGPDQLHICMCYSPMRYAWDLQHQYLKEANLDSGFKSCLVRYLLYKLRLWDVRTSNSVDFFIAISEFISRRIKKVYRRESFVIYPPVNTNEFTLVYKKEDFYLAVSRMVPYKKMPMIVKAFSLTPNRKLILIGDGPELESCIKQATPNITVMGWQNFEKVKNYMQKARAFIFASEEDFGIAPLEAQACGTPVIAFAKGGALETIKGFDSDFPTGVFFEEQTPDSLNLAIDFFEANSSKILPEECRKNALKFSQEIFKENFKSFMSRKWSEFYNDII